MMDEAKQLLDNQLKNLGRNILDHGGSVAMADARKYAERQYAIYKEEQKKLRHAVADKIISQIKGAQKILPKGK
jgi:hypothetical protein